MVAAKITNQDLDHIMILRLFPLQLQIIWFLSSHLSFIVTGSYCCI